MQGRHWTINPIDGIEGFEGLRQYGISHALLEDGKVILSCSAIHTICNASQDAVEQVVAAAQALMHNLAELHHFHAGA